MKSGWNIEHVVPSYHNWLRMLNIELELMFPHAEWDTLGPINPQPQSINDFTAYNTEGQLFPAQKRCDHFRRGWDTARQKQSAVSTGSATWSSSSR